MEALQSDIGYTYKNIELLRTAMTHSSYCNETKHGKQRLQDNERLEFLGDSVLSVLVSDYIFNSYSDLNEGDLTKTRAASVCEDSLFLLATDLKLGEYMLFGHGESSTRGRLRKSILADAFEALLASMYLDGGLETARAFLLPKIIPIIDKAAKGWDTDYKSRLQKLVQQTPEEVLEYKLLEEVGPPHDRVFKTAVYLNSNMLGEGWGRTKREAEQQAAKMALGFFGEE
ncbi:MAG: ribonuclease III [Ruminococcaceae bacterium]|nr:ribonuclease III [Oscillospiraceae bacterium]